MIHSIRFKLIISLLIVSFLVGGVFLFIVHRLLYSAVTHEAQNYSRLALNATHDVYRAHINFIRTALDITTLGSGFQSSVINRDLPDLSFRINRLATNAQLDFAGIVAGDGALLCILNPRSGRTAISLQENPLVRQAIHQNRMVAGTVVFLQEFMILENPELAERLKALLANEQKTCMAIGAAIPIYGNLQGENLTAVLYGGRLLHQSTNIVDSIPESFFFDQRYIRRKSGNAFNFNFRSPLFVFTKQVYFIFIPGNYDQCYDRRFHGCFFDPSDHTACSSVG